MLNATDSYRDIRLVKPDNPDYIAFMRRMADSRPSRGGPRHAGEFLGGLVEQCVRHWLGSSVPLQEERILTWEQRLRNGRHGRLFRELDAVWTIDSESLCLYEMKLTFPENMIRGVGLKQLDIATETLLLSRRYRYVLQRLVYVAAEPLAVLADDDDPAGLPALAPDNEYEELGVVWVSPDAVTQAAQTLGITLPDNWLEPESREGSIEDPERDVWRQYADTEARLESERDDSPLAQALRQRLGNKDRG